MPLAVDSAADADVVDQVADDPVAVVDRNDPRGPKRKPPKHIS